MSVQLPGHSLSNIPPLLGRAKAGVPWGPQNVTKAQKKGQPSGFQTIFGSTGMPQGLTSHWAYFSSPRMLSALGL